MATLATTLDRNLDAQRVDNWSKRFVAAKNELDGLFNNLESALIKYPSSTSPDENTEIIGKHTDARGLLQTLLDDHPVQS